MLPPLILTDDKQLPERSQAPNPLLRVEETPATDVPLDISEKGLLLGAAAGSPTKAEPAVHPNSLPEPSSLPEPPSHSIGGCFLIPGLLIKWGFSNPVDAVCHLATLSSLLFLGFNAAWILYAFWGKDCLFGYFARCLFILGSGWGFHMVWMRCVLYKLAMVYRLGLTRVAMAKARLEFGAVSHLLIMAWSLASLVALYLLLLQRDNGGTTLCRSLENAVSGSGSGSGAATVVLATGSSVPDMVSRRSLWLVFMLWPLLIVVLTKLSRDPVEDDAGVWSQQAIQERAKKARAARSRGGHGHSLGAGRS